MLSVATDAMSVYVAWMKFRLIEDAEIVALCTKPPPRRDTRVIMVNVWDIGIYVGAHAVDEGEERASRESSEEMPIAPPSTP